LATCTWPCFGNKSKSKSAELTRIFPMALHYHDEYWFSVCISIISLQVWLESRQINHYIDVSDPWTRLSRYSKYTLYVSIRHRLLRNVYIINIWSVLTIIFINSGFWLIDLEYSTTSTLGLNCVNMSE
jgi:hypothetical protein